MSDDYKENTIEKFSDFVNQYPLLLEDIRNSGEPIQTYYEKWALLGEQDPFWNKYKQNDKEKEESDKLKKPDWIEEILQYSKNINLEQVQKHVHSISEAVQSLQTIISQFKENPSEQKNKKHTDNLFRLFKD